MDFPTKASSNNYFLGFALKQTNLLDFKNFLLYANTYNTSTMFVIEGWKITSEDIIKYQIHPELISISGELTTKTRFVKGSHELFLQLCKKGRNVHLFEFIEHLSRFNWLDASVAANVDVLKKHAVNSRSYIPTTYILHDNQLNYGRPVTIIYGDNGMGKTTCLNHVRKELTIQNENQFILYLDDIKLREFYRSFPSANIINFIEYFAVDLINPDVHIMYDNFERLKERDVIIDIMTDVHLKYRHVKQWITCSDADCRNKLESKLCTFASSLEPISQESQINYLKHIWTTEDDDEEDDLDEFIKSIVDQCNKWKWKDIYNLKHFRFTTYPLHLRMIASAFSPSCELELGKVSVLDVYEGFINSVYSNKNIDESAVLQLFEYMNHEFKFKTNVEFPNKTFNFVNVTNYLAAKWFSKNYNDHQGDLSLLLNSRGNWSFQYFFNSLLCRGKQLHTAALNRWRIYDLCSAATVNERDDGGRTALHLVEDKYLMRYLLDRSALVDAKDDVLQWTPLQYCDYNGHLKCLNVLLERGADTRQLTWTLGLSEDQISKRFEYATSYPKLTFYVKFICQNVKKFQVTPRTINEVFFDLPKDVSMMVLSHAQKSTYHFVDRSGRTSLFHAVKYNHFDAVKFLINNLEFDIHHRCCEGKTVFHKACKKGFTDIAKYFLDLGVDVNVSYGNLNANAFTDCCKKDNVDVMTFLIENGADVNVSLTSGKTPLELACEHGSTAVVKYLCENVAKLKINYNISNENLMNLLHDAVSCASTELVEFLLNLSRKQIININKKFNGKNLLHVACTLTDDYEASIVSMLIQAGADVNATDDNGCNPIFEMFHGCPIKAVKFLADSGCNLSHFNNDGETPLHDFTRNCLSAYSGSQDDYYELVIILDELLIYGADVNARTPTGDTPLHFACRNNNITVIHTLLSQGADIHAVNDKGETPLHLGCIKKCTQRYSEFKTVEHLVRKGADVNARTNSGKTPIMYAVSFPSNIKTLLNLGADGHCKDKDNKTVLHYFTEHNLLKEIKILAKEGVRDARTTDSAGQTALHIAANNNYFQCFKYLIKYFVTDVNIVDKEGKTAIELAHKNLISIKSGTDS